MDVQINWIAILLAGVASQVIGMLWYSPFLFGKMWAKEMGFGKMSPAKMKKMQQEAIPAYIASFVCAMVTAYVLSHFVTYLRVTTIEGVLQLVFWTWLGFTATVEVTNQFFGKKSVKLFVINALFQLALFAAIGVILVKI